MSSSNNTSNSTTLVSWNVRGLNNPIKRNKIFSHLNKLHSYIVYLQETKLLIKDHSRLFRGGFTQCFHSEFNSKSRGVAILIHRDVQYTETKTIRDKNGRFVITQGKLFSKPVVLANVYGPNWDNAAFFTALFSMLPDLDSHDLILAGDLNCTLDSSLDRSSSKTITPSKSAYCINEFLKAYGVVDPWRFRYPTSKQFSFFSPVHQSYSRIDYFLIDQKLLHMVTKIEYSSIVISDHAPVILQLSFPENTPTFSWRLNSRHLSDEKFVEFINTQIDLFMELNDTPGISYSLIWETLKAYIRGQVISFVAAENAKQTKRASQIIDRIKEVDQLHSESPPADLYKERLLLQTEFDSITNTKAIDLHLRSRLTYYEHGDRAGKLLSHQLKQLTTAGFITAVKNEQGQILTDQIDINTEFKSFYEKLYTSSACDKTQVENFFNDLPLPTLDESNKNTTESDITQFEISEAIKKMKSGKAPGPDGYPIEFFKKFTHKLVPLLSKLYTEIFDKKALPPTMTQATISLLLKKEKDPLLCESYRPISLLNCDYKILAKILAGRLEKALSKLIHPDQTGFVVGRQISSNLRRIFNVIYQRNNAEPEVLISLDAQKAFDRVEYNFLFTTLQKFGFGPVFRFWISILYAKPQASIRTNKIMSSYFSLSRGARQGCPLSPLLFNIAIEPLAVMLRKTAQLTGIQRGGESHKLCLYADDLLLFLSNPEDTIPLALSSINKFGQVSGYKLNLSKSVLFPINKKAQQLTFQGFPFKITKDHFNYLGVCVTNNYKNLFEKNFKSALDKAKQDIDKWSKLPLSLVGRINSVKMIILPRFLYLFQTVPVFISKAYFKELNRHLSMFIWNKTTPRIRREFLEKKREDGGLALPNFLYYYRATNIQKKLFWLEDPSEPESPSWARMEKYSSSPISLSSLICSSLPLSKHHWTNNVVVQGSLKIWFQFRIHFKFRNALVATPIQSNVHFAPSLIDPSFQRWHRKGLSCVKDLFKNGIFATFDQLIKDFNMLQSDFFRFLQIRSFVKKTFSLTLPPKTWLDECLELCPYDKGLVSVLYNRIQGAASPSLIHFKSKWEEELDEQFADDTWQAAITRIHTSSICVRHSLIQFKILHRLHLSPSKIAKLYPGADSACPRCGFSPANLSHMFWVCPSLYTFWQGIFEIISSLCNTSIGPNSTIALFGVAPPHISVTLYQASAIAFITLLARRIILFNWKKSTPPSLKRLIEEVMSNLKLEHLRHIMNGSLQTYRKIWQPFLIFFETEFKI